jgi:hypothetical protein
MLAQFTVIELETCSLLRDHDKQVVSSWSLSLANAQLQNQTLRKHLHVKFHLCSTIISLEFFEMLISTLRLDYTHYTRGTEVAEYLRRQYNVLSTSDIPPFPFAYSHIYFLFHFLPQSCQCKSKEQNTYCRNLNAAMHENPLQLSAIGVCCAGLKK